MTAPPTIKGSGAEFPGDYRWEELDRQCAGLAGCAKCIGDADELLREQEGRRDDGIGAVVWSVGLFVAGAIAGGAFVWWW